MRRLIIPPIPWHNPVSLYFAPGSLARLSGGNAHSVDYPWTQPLTFSYWIRRLAGDTAKASIISREKDTANFSGYDSLLIVGRVMGYWNGLGTYTTDTVQVSTSTTVPNDGNTWCHCVTTWDGSGRASGFQFYFDRVLQPKRAADFDNLSTMPLGESITFRIGDALDGLTYYLGYLNNIAILKRCLTLEEIETELVDQNGKPCDLSRVPDLDHWYQPRMYGDKPDTAGVIYDRIGDLDLTVHGDLAFSDSVP